MKKILCALLAVLMLLTLCACGGDKGNDTANDASSSDVVEAGYYFEDNGVKLEIGAPAANVEALGTPADVFEEASCAFEGKDVTNFYPNYQILLAYPNEGAPYIYSITITSDAVATPEGLEVGMSLEDVFEIYGECEPGENENLRVFKKGNVQIKLLMADGLVEAITYTAAE